MTARTLGLLRFSYQSATADAYVERLCSSWILSKWLPLVFRATFSIYAFVTLFYVIGHRLSIGQAEGVQQSFSYFTVLGYWGLAWRLFIRLRTHDVDELCCTRGLML